MKLIVKSIGITFNQGKQESFSPFTDISFSISSGKSLSIMGVSGSGKSTIYKILSGLLEPTYGSVWIDQINLSNLKEEERAKARLEYFNLIFQEDTLFPFLSVLENVYASAVFLGKKVDEGIQKTAVELLEYLRLQDRLNYFPEKLSGGERQRVAIARALLMPKKFILADEPTAQLDEDSSRRVVELILERARLWGASVLLITHDERLSKLCDDSYRLSFGVLKHLAIE